MNIKILYELKSKVKKNYKNEGITHGDYAQKPHPIITEF